MLLIHYYLTILIVMSTAMLVQSEIYKIATFLPFSSVQYQNLNHSISSALEHINKRSIEEQSGVSLELYNSYPDEIITENVTRAFEIREELLEVPELVALLGAYASHSTLALSEMMNGTGYPILTFSSTAVALSTRPDIIRFVASDIVEVTAITDFLFVANWDNIFVIHSDTVYGESGLNSTIIEATGRGLTIIGSYAIKHPENDFHSLFQAVKASGAKTFVNILSYGSFIFNNTDYFTVAKSYGLMDDGYNWFFSQTFDHVVKNNFPDEALLRNLSTGVFMIAQQNARWSYKADFLKLMNKRLTGVESPLDHELLSRLTLYDNLAYDAVISLYETIVKMKKNMEDPFDSELLRKRILKYQNIGASGTISFDSNGDRLGLKSRIVNIGLNGTQQDLAHYSLEEGIHNVKGATSKSTQLTVYTVGSIVSKKLNIFLETPKPSGSKFISIPLFGESPSERYGYCSKVIQNKILIYAGRDKDTYLNDLFEYGFDTARWRYISPLSKYIPDGREGCMCEVDGSQLYFLHGKDEYYILDDFNMFNLEAQTFHQINMISPLPRYNGGLINRNGTLFMFAGISSIGYLNDMWQYTISEDDRWTQISYNSLKNPPPMDNFGIVYMQENDALYIFGGRTKNFNYDSSTMWKFDFTLKEWNIVAINSVNGKPAGRYACGMNSFDSTIFIAMGWITDFVDISLADDLWSVDISVSEPEWTHEADLNPMSKRDSAPLLRWNDQLIMFGGQDFTISKNDFFAYDLALQSLREVHPNNFSPLPLTESRAVRISSKMLIWGGVTVHGNELPAHIAYCLDLENLVWSFVRTRNEPPKTRHSHSAIAVGDQMFIFGGKSKDSTYHDLWAFSFDIINNEGLWHEISPVGMTPSPRADHAAFYDGKNMYITHGRYQTYHTDFWTFDIELETWKSNAVTGSASYKSLLDCNTAFLPKFRSAYYIGCTNLDGFTHATLFKYHIDMQTFQEFMNTFEYMQGNTLSRSLVEIIRDDSLIVYGGNQEETVTNNIHIINVELEEIFPLQPLDYYFPDPRTFAIGTYYLNKLFLFGGTAALPGATRLVKSLIVGDAWVIDLTPILHDGYIPKLGEMPPAYCSPGSREVRGICIPCEKGTYREFISSSQKNCLPCPPGEFSNIVGANSRTLCRPCEAGTYTPNYGSINCLPCPPNKYCPISSTFPQEKVARTSNQSPIIIQPNRYAPNLQLNQILSYALLSIAGLGSIVMAVTLLCLWKLRIIKLKQMIFFDRIYTTSHHSYFGLMRRKQTVVGAIFSIIAACLVIMYFTAFTVDYFNGGNIEEYSTFLPAFTLSNREFELRNFSISVEVYTYRGNCVRDNIKNSWGVCHHDIGITTHGFNAVNVQPYYQKRCYWYVPSSSSQTANCKVSWFCQGCIKSTKADILFAFEEDESFASALSYTVKSYSGYGENTYSEVKHSIVSDDNTLFRGRQPTIIRLHSFLTHYNHSYSTLGGLQKFDRVYTGYHLDFESVAPGSQVNHQTYHHSSGLKLQFVIEDQQYVLNIQRSEKREFTRFVTETLAACAGIIVFLQFLMTGIERAVDGLKLTNSLPVEEQDRIDEIGFLLRILRKLSPKRLWKSRKPARKNELLLEQFAELEDMEDMEDMEDQENSTLEKIIVESHGEDETSH